MKTTRLQAANTGSLRYFTGKPCSKGHVAERYTKNGACVVCSVLGRKAYMAEYRKSDARKAYMAEYTKSEYWKNRRAEYRLNNKAKIAEADKRRYESIKERILAKNKEWKNANKGVEKARLKNKNATRKRVMGGQVLALLHKEATLLLYKHCPDGYHVDHIVPLRGKMVCGLHVPWNLQYLPAKENAAKGNKFETI